MAYSEKVVDHYEHPRNVGSLDKNDPQVGTGLVGAPACGDVMKLQIRVSDGGAPVDATVALVDGRPQVIPAKPGVQFEPVSRFTSGLIKLVPTSWGPPSRCARRPTPGSSSSRCRTRPRPPAR